MDIDIDENILDNSVLDLLFNQDTPKILTVDEIIDELRQSKSQNDDI